MPSKKKKARGKTRRAAKSRKAKEEEVENGIGSEMQRLHNNKIKNKDDDDEDALLEEAINLAAAEREELEATAKNDDVNNSEECHHGLVPYPRNHIFESFLESFDYEYNVCRGELVNLSLYQVFREVYEATRTKYAEVWNDPRKIQWVASCYLNFAVDLILQKENYFGGMKNYFRGRQFATFSCFFDQLAQATCDWDIFEASSDWGKIVELYDGDEHTVVSFCRKRIPCKCLENKYKEVASIVKMGICRNLDCSLPGQKAARSKMLYCTQCRRANYCSRECQVAHWPFHKEFCVAASRLTARKSRQKK